LNTLNPEFVFDSHDHRMNILKALQEIGPGAKSAVPLLKELRAVSPARSPLTYQWGETEKFFDEVNKTLFMIGEASDDEPSGSKPLLGEFSHLATTWKLASSRPGKTKAGVTLKIGDGLLFGPQVEGPMTELVLETMGWQSSGPGYVIDETTTPRQITALGTDGKTRESFGIYEMKGDTLKIEFAKPGLPRPKEFSSDRDKLPEGHVLLEFERDLGKE
jgi:hypothetical protein